MIDGANEWHMFRHITLPLVLPFIMVALIIRTIDALKAFDTIFVITQGGPGTASETHQHLPLSAGLRVLQDRLRLGRGGDLLLIIIALSLAAALHAAEIEVERVMA